MFQHIDDALEALLRADEPLLTEAPISFESAAPDDSDGDGDDTATLQLHLWRVSMSAKSARSGSEVVEREDGVKVRREFPPAVELSYAVTVRSGPARERHRLLAAALRTFLRHPEIDPDLVPVEVAETGALVKLRIPKFDPTDAPMADAGAPTIDLRVTVPLELGRELVLPDAPGSTDFGFEDPKSGATSTRRRYAGTVADPAAVGVDVLGPSGAGSVAEDGRFVIVARPGEQIAIMVDPPVTVTVPESGQIVVT